MDGHLALSATAAPPWLEPWLAWLDRALHREILRLRARYELTMDELRGLYVSDEQVDRLVARADPSADVHAQMAGLDVERAALFDRARASPGRLGDLVTRLGLGATDLLAVVLCLAPEVDLRYQSIYAYLNDDVTRRLPTVDLCQRLRADGDLLDVHSRVISEGVIGVQRTVGAPLWRSAGLVLGEPVRRFLLGTDPQPEGTAQPGTAVPHARMLLLDGPSDEAAYDAARSLCRGERLISVEHDEAEPLDRLRQGLLRARLHGATLVVSAARDLGLVDDEPLRADPLRLFQELVETPARIVLLLRRGAADRLPLQGVDHQRHVVQPPGPGARAQLWANALDANGVTVGAVDVEQVAALFALGSTEIQAAAMATARAGSGDLVALTRAARSCSGYGLDGVAERVRTSYRWDDLVLPAATVQRLVEVEGAIRNRHSVFDDWNFGRLAGGHSSVRVLFSGPSGTGKTMSASVVAGQLGLELYRVDLSAVVSKYIGETEKNLERVLSAAENSNAVLLFDEAEALFGKRTEVKDAHDRYANIETAFLLQRIESFDGVVILATNLVGNLDESFSRRIQFHVEFPVPDDAAREQLWRQALPETAPVDDDFDPAFLAGMFAMTGGEVRSASLIAAFMAAREGTPIAMRHLVVALARQRRQQGKMPSSSEFKGYLRLIRDEVG
ncbi:MAG: ATP-binding protein [Marmoricola sp.]